VIKYTPKPIFGQDYDAPPETLIGSGRTPPLDAKVDLCSAAWLLAPANENSWPHLCLVLFNGWKMDKQQADIRLGSVWASR